MVGFEFRWSILLASAFTYQATLKACLFYFKIWDSLTKLSSLVLDQLCSLCRPLPWKIFLPQLTEMVLLVCPYRPGKIYILILSVLGLVIVLSGCEHLCGCVLFVGLRNNPHHVVAMWLSFCLRQFSIYPRLALTSPLPPALTFLVLGLKVVPPCKGLCFTV